MHATRACFAHGIAPACPQSDSWLGLERPLRTHSSPDCEGSGQCWLASSPGRRETQQSGCPLLDSRQEAARYVQHGTCLKDGFRGAAADRVCSWRFRIRGTAAPSPLLRENDTLLKCQYKLEHNKGGAVAPEMLPRQRRCFAGPGSSNVGYPGGHSSGSLLAAHSTTNLYVQDAPPGAATVCQAVLRGGAWASPYGHSTEVTTVDCCLWATCWRTCKPVMLRFAARSIGGSRS